MAGPQDIQRLPTGLIDLLGMKATGQTPLQLDPNTQAGLEVFNLYTNDRRITLTGAPGVAPTVGGFLTNTTGPVVVPAGQLWLVYHVSCVTLGAAAGTSIKGFPTVLRVAGGGVSVPIPLTKAFETLDGARGNMEFEEYPTPIILRPSDNFGFFTLAITGAPGVTPITRLDYAPLLL